MPCLLCGAASSAPGPSGPVCAVCGWRLGDAPDPDLPPPRVDVVYYLRFRDRVKIGTTANPRQRFAAIRHEKLLAFERGDRRVEHARHEQFAADRFPGSEWFHLTPPIQAHIELLAAGRAPWDVYARWIAEAYSSRA